MPCSSWFTYLHHFFSDFFYCALNFEVKGLKGFVRIRSEIAFVISNCILFLKAQSSQPNWIFSKSSEPLLQTLAQNPDSKVDPCSNPKHKACKRIPPTQD